MVETSVVLGPVDDLVVVPSVDSLELVEDSVAAGVEDSVAAKVED